MGLGSGAGDMKSVFQQVFPGEPEVRSWFLISVAGFWVRHPVVGAVSGSVPEELQPAFRLFTGYGSELGVVEHHLRHCVNELKIASGYGLEDHERKKFAIVYHVDNFYVRVHKLKENVYRLLAKVVALDHERRPDPGERFEKQVKDCLNERGLEPIARAVRALENNKNVRRAFGARTLFVHQFREEPEWPMLGAKALLWQVGKEGDPFWWLTNQPVREEGDLDRYAKGKVEELSDTLAAIRHFRDELLSILFDKLRGLLSAGAADTENGP